MIGGGVAFLISCPILHGQTLSAIKQEHSRQSSLSNAEKSTKAQPDSLPDLPIPLTGAGGEVSGHVASNASTNSRSMDSITQELLIPFEDRSGKWGYMDRRTKQIEIEPVYQWAELFNGGLAKVSVPDSLTSSAENSVNGHSLYGFIDRTGKQIFKPQFKQIYPVDRYLGSGDIPDLKMVALSDGNYGIIDLKKGGYLVQPGQYTDFSFFDKSTYLADKKVLVLGDQQYRAPKGTEITQVDLEQKTFDLTKKDELHKGISRFNGDWIIPPKYMDISFLPEANRYLANRYYKKLTEQALMALLSSKGIASGSLITDLYDSTGKLLGSYRGDYNADPLNDSIGVYTRSDSSFYFSFATGNSVQTPGWEQSQHGDFRIFKRGLLWGIDEQRPNQGEKEAKIVVPAIYTSLYFITDSLVLATRPSDHKSYQQVQGVFLLNSSGAKTLIPFEYNRLEYVKSSQGPGPHFRGYKDGKHGILDMHGQVRVPFIYDNDVIYFGPRAEVYKNYRSGVIDAKGQVVIPCAYKTIFSSKLGREDHDNNPTKAMDSSISNDSISKNTETTAEYYSLENDDGKWGLMDSASKLIIPFDYGYVSTGPESFKRGWVSTEDSKRHFNGKINIKTGVKIPPVYDVIRMGKKQIVVAKRHENTYYYQLLSLQGKALTDTNYTQMDYIPEGDFLLAVKDQKYGVLTTNGQILIPFKYDYLWVKSSDLLMAENNGHYFYLDTKGQTYLSEK